MDDEFPTGVLVAWRVIGATYAAACVWLGVRVFNRRERWAKWTLATVVSLPLLYPLSFGPACWWFSSEKPAYAMMPPVAPNAYWPIGWLANKGPRSVQKVIVWYANQNGEVALPIDWTGHRWGTWRP